MKDIEDRVAAVQASLKGDKGMRKEDRAVGDAVIGLIGAWLTDQRRIADALEKIANRSKT